MCVEFYLILKAAGATTKHLKVLIWASVAMLVTGYVGEAGLGNAAVWGGLGITILLYGYPLYAGACLGVGAKYFFDYFKK